MAFTMDSMMLKSRAHQNPSTLKPSMSSDMIMMIRAFITKVKSQTVTRFIGSVSNRSTGRIKVLMSARRIATPNAGINPDNVTPGKIYAVMITARAVTKRFTMIHVVSIGIKLRSKPCIICKILLFSNFISLDTIECTEEQLIISYHYSCKTNHTLSPQKLAEKFSGKLQ